MFNKLKVKPFDINGDGKVDLNDIKAIFTGERYYQKSSLEIVEGRVKKIWSSNKHHFEYISVCIQKRYREGGSFYYKLISSNENKIEKTIKNLLKEFNDNDLDFYRDDYFNLSEKISSIDKKVAELRAASVLEGDNKYQGSIEKFEQDQKQLRAMQERALTFFESRLNNYGIKLTREQTETLISRCDAHENSQMTSVFYLIKCIVEQLARALKESNEDLDIAKKYYAIFVGLLEIQLYIQDMYIKKIDSTYVPNLTVILKQSYALQDETTKLAKNSPNTHQEIYKQNLKSQRVTIEVAELYCSILDKQKEKVITARKLVSERHKVAKNTLSTVSITAELSSLIRESENLFNELINLQTPEFEGFQNNTMKEEFIRMTEKIKEN